MQILAVDLAARYSAACLIDNSAQVLWQVDSWVKTENGFINSLATVWDTAPGIEKPAVMVVEDLPHKLPFHSLIKRVCRIQGRIIDRMISNGVGDLVLFLPPDVWRRSFQGLERGTGPKAVVGVAKEFDYQSPDLSHRVFTSKDRATAKKVATDYCAAYLIARWALETYQAHGTFDVYGTSRYQGVDSSGS